MTNPPTPETSLPPTAAEVAAPAMRARAAANVLYMERCRDRGSSWEARIEAERALEAAADILDRLIALSPRTATSDHTHLADLAETYTKPDELTRVTVILMKAWAEGDPNSGPSRYPASYVATFVDMARAIIADRGAARAEAVALAGSRGWISLPPAGEASS